MIDRWSIDAVHAIDLCNTKSPVPVIRLQQEWRVGIQPIAAISSLILAISFSPSISFDLHRYVNVKLSHHR